MLDLNRKTNEEIMDLCIQIAESNIDSVGNKAVGAILLGRSGKVYTGNRYTFLNHLGLPHKTVHAEQMTIWEAGKDAEYGKLYVTMEPCNKRWHNSQNFHYEPCTKLIVKAGISTVYYGSYDESFGQYGKGYLEDHGIDTIYIEGFDERIRNISVPRVEDIVKKEFDEFIKDNQ